MISFITDVAHGGEGWCPRDHADEEKSIWRSHGVSNEFGRLRTVLLHRPGVELNQVHHPNEVHWNALIDFNKAQQQFDALMTAYLELGVEVILLEPPKAYPNHFFVRDLFAMTPKGAILARPASSVRAGEELAVYHCLARHNIPILGSILGEGVFEGPDLVFIDASTAMVANSIRSSHQGVAQVKQLLNQHAIKTIEVQTTYGCGHLDGVVNILDTDKALLFPRRVSLRVYEVLKEKGFHILELPCQEEAENKMAINMVAVSPGKVLMPSGCPNTARYLRNHGVEVLEVDVSELMKGGGAIHCMTGPIWRDPY